MAIAGGTTRTITGAAARARPISVGSAYPARELCSRCGLCDTPLVSEVSRACAFIGDGMARMDRAEAVTHGRARQLDDENELYFGVHTELAAMRMLKPVPGAAWTGVVTSIAIEALESGLVDAVIAVGARSANGPERMVPRPMLCRTAAQIRACSGVKPVLANSLHLLERVRTDASIRRLLFIGVGCQVQALRAVEPQLGLEALYVLGTNCADNVRTPQALRRFMAAVSSSPDTAVGFEFMQVRANGGTTGRPLTLLAVFSAHVCPFSHCSNFSAGLFGACQARASATIVRAGV